MRVSYFARKYGLAGGLVLSFFILLLLGLPIEEATAGTLQLKNDNDVSKAYISSIRPCWVFGSVLQAAPNQYPLRVLSVDFILYQDFQNAASSAQVRAVVFSIGADGRPDTLLARSETVTVTAFDPNWVSIPMTNTQIFLTNSESFLVGVEYVDGVAGTVPSVLMDSNTNIPVGRNFYSQTCGGSWFEHYEWWMSPSNVGYNMVRATVDANTPLVPTWTPTATSTPTPGAPPTPIPGQVTPGVIVGGGKEHTLARTTDGRVHLIYAEPTRQELYQIWSHDNGGSWQPSPPLLVAVSDQMEAAMASGPADTLHLAYGPWDGHQVYYNGYDGSDWGIETQIGDQAFGRNIAVDSQGQVHVVWSNSDTWYTRFDGISWSPPRQIAIGAWHPAIAVGPDDSLHVAFNDNDYCCDHDGVEVRYMVSADGGNTWSQPENVSQDGVWSGGASLAVTPDGIVHLIYIARSPIMEGALYYRQRQAGQWSLPEVISSGNAGVTTGSTGADSAAVAIDEASNLFVVFRCLNAAGRWDMCLRIRDWQGWSPVMDMTNNVGVDSNRPSVVYGIIPEDRGLDSAWNTAGYVIYRYLPREELPLHPTPTPTPTSTPSPGAYYARVVDESDEPVNGARIYHNRRLVTGADGQPLLTRNGGVLNFSSLQPGDTLVAVALQDQRSTSRQGHDIDPDPRYPGQAWAYRVYVTSMEIDDQGTPHVYRVPDASAGEHRLVVMRTNPLVLFNVVVSIEWDATITYTDQISRALTLASAYLYDLTDGHMALGRVSIYDNGDYWADADIQISAKNIVHPHAYIGGITSEDKSHVIRVGRYWDGQTGNQGAWDEPDGYRTLAHEFGHYALHLYDEYFAYTFDQNGNLTGEIPAYCTGPENRNPVTDATNASVMDYQYTSSELSARGVPGLWSALCEATAQWQFNRESAWETTAREYADLINPPRWQFTTPADRGSIMAGPAGELPELPDWPVIEVHQSGPSAPPRHLTVYGPQGLYWGAIVALYKQNGQVIGQGFTDSNGRLDVYGADEGDTLRGASFDGGLSGNVVLGPEMSLNMSMAPVGGLAVQAGEGIPHMQVRAEPSQNPEQVDLLISLQNFGPGADPIVVVTEPGSDVSHTPRLTYSPATGTYEGEFSFSASERGWGQIRAVGAVGNDLVRLQSTYHLQQVVNDQEQDVYSNDGNLGLHFEPGSLPGAAAYLVIMPPGAAPGPPPEGLTLVGDPYSVTASGALVELEKPAVLKLRYDATLVNQSSPPAGLDIYRWNPSDNSWQRVPGSIEEEQRAMVAAVTTLGTYALLAPPGEVTRGERVYLPLILK